jgi:hypothetical protein
MNFNKALMLPAVWAGVALLVLVLVVVLSPEQPAVVPDMVQPQSGSGQ